VDRGWVLLELHRDSQTLEDVFRSLTIGDERRNRRIGPDTGAPDEDDEEDSGDDDDEAAAPRGAREDAKAASGERS
jgi:ABC-2 type transport system ATP-binding protein